MTTYTIPANQPKIEGAFWEFHFKHPEVYAAIVETARFLRNKKWGAFGIATVYEIVRYRALVGEIKIRPKLNNNYRAYYARLINRKEPDFAGFFKTRELSVPHHEAPA